MDPSTVALLIWLVLPIVLLVLWLRARKKSKTFSQQIENQKQLIDELKEKYSPIMSIEAELDRL